MQKVCHQSSRRPRLSLSRICVSRRRRSDLVFLKRFKLFIGILILLKTKQLEMLFERSEYVAWWEVRLRRSDDGPRLPRLCFFSTRSFQLLTLSDGPRFLLLSLSLSLFTEENCLVKSNTIWLHHTGQRPTSKDSFEKTTTIFFLIILRFSFFFSFNFLTPFHSKRERPSVGNGMGYNEPCKGRK